MIKVSKKNVNYLKRNPSLNAIKQNILSKIYALPNHILSLANSTLNPKPLTICRLWHKYLKENYSKLSGPFDRLVDKIPEYLKQVILFDFIMIN